MRLAFLLAACAIMVLAALLLWSSPGLTVWMIEQQRAFQTTMADAVFGLKTGAAGAWGALLGAAGAYGFVHALGPGHGKYLIGGVGLGTSVSSTRLLSLAVASSVAQALWAIALVYGGFALVEASANQMTHLAENILTPMSYLAIAAVGLVIIWRGARSISGTRQHGPQSEATCGCGHAHGPTPREAARVTTLRDALALIISIAIRPCTGAIFLLVIAWQMDIKAAGAVAVLVMGLGTAALTSTVALSSTAARHAALASTSGVLNHMQIALPAIQVLIGGLVLLVSVTLLTHVL